MSCLQLKIAFRPLRFKCCGGRVLNDFIAFHFTIGISHWFGVRTQFTIMHAHCPNVCVLFAVKTIMTCKKPAIAQKSVFFLPFIWCMFTLFHFVFNARNSHCCVKSDVLQRLNCDCLLMVDKHALFSASKWNSFSPNCQPYGFECFLYGI